MGLYIVLLIKLFRDTNNYENENRNRKRDFAKKTENKAYNQWTLPPHSTPLNSMTICTETLCVHCIEITTLRFVYIYQLYL